LPLLKKQLLRSVKQSALQQKQWAKQFLQSQTLATTYLQRRETLRKNQSYQRLS
jgi:hypothetical protein